MTDSPFTQIDSKHVLDEWVKFLHFVDANQCMCDDIVASPCLTTIEFGNQEQRYDTTTFLGRQPVNAPGYMGSTCAYTLNFRYWTAISHAAPPQFKRAHPTLRWDPNTYQVFHGHTPLSKVSHYTNAVYPDYSTQSMGAIQSQLCRGNMLLWSSISQRTDFNLDLLNLIPESALRKINFTAICSSPSLDFTFVDKHINDFPWDFVALSQHPKLLWEFVYKHAGRPWCKPLLRNHPFLHQTRLLIAKEEAEAEAKAKEEAEAEAKAKAEEEGEAKAKAEAEAEGEAKAEAKEEGGAKENKYEISDMEWDHILTMASI